MHGVTETFPQLSITSLANGCLRLEDTSYSEGAIVDVHPAHVRLMAERLGFVRDVSAPDADAKTLAELARDVDRLQRNLLRVREHALGLQKDFASGADWDHADLSHEMNQINALVGLLDMACDDFSDFYTAVDPEPPRAVSGDVPRDSPGTQPGPNPAATTSKAFPEGSCKASAPRAVQEELELPT